MLLPSCVLLKHNRVTLAGLVPGVWGNLGSLRDQGPLLSSYGWLPLHIPLILALHKL